ncbi:MAG: HIT domain-containing protein [Candidatus Cloacimonetes bacterium]|nr:HIT domain-containing protein [Candidatus Cloacimonadota bacterium]
MYDKNNVFAKIIRGEIPAKKIFENEYALSIEDIDPVASIHALIMPKGEYAEIYDFVSKASVEEQKGFWEVFQKTAEILDLKENFNTLTNSKKPPFFVQSVPHFHLHLIGGKKIKNLTNW